MHIQTIKFKPEELEPNFHGMKDEAGNKIEFLYGNKGL
jgi:hypothetical protein